MSAPDLISIKDQELKAQHGGRELLSMRDVLKLLGISRVSAYYLGRRGMFIRVTRIGLRNLYYHVADVAAYLLGGHATQDAPLPPAATPPPAPKKIGRPRKRRTATAAAAS